MSCVCYYVFDIVSSRDVIIELYNMRNHIKPVNVLKRFVRFKNSKIIKEHIYAYLVFSAVITPSVVEIPLKSKSLFS